MPMSRKLSLLLAAPAVIAFSTTIALANPADSTCSILNFTTVGCTAGAYF